MLYVRGRGVNFVTRHQGSWYSKTWVIDNTQLYLAMAEAVGIR